MLADNIINEARAQITWGEELATVRMFLISNGMSATDADGTLRNLIHERNVEIRKIGIRDIVIGGGLVATITIFFSVAVFHMRTSSGAVKIYTLLVIGWFYGVWRLFNGIYRLARPKSEHGSIPDISE